MIALTLAALMIAGIVLFPWHPRKTGLFSKSM